MSRKEIYYSIDEATLLAVEFVASTSVSVDASNYWEIDLRRVRGDQAFGEDIGDTFSLATHSLTAGEPVTLYDDEHGTEMKAGDRIVAEFTETGSAARLVDAVFYLKVQRKVR